MCQRFFLCVTIILVSTQTYSQLTDKQSRPKSPTKIDFVREIQPILRKHCYECHGSDVQEGGVRLDLKKSALSGGENGKVIVVGKAKESRLIHLVAGTADDGQVMPPKEEGTPLSKQQIALLVSWINQGAAWPDGVDGVEKSTKALWSFAPVKRPVLPNVKQVNWIRNPIDRFILARLEAAKMNPAPEVGSRTLIRRAYFDLLGLPPDPDDAAASLDDRTFEQMVNRLLANPHYGERWGRHWLDLVRYADSNGYEVDGEKPMAWKYRDYVVRALNADKPYDQFIIEQLAGDEIANANSETIIATGFIRVGPWDAERGASVQPSEVIEERFNELDDMVSTTSQVFLGMTIGCARCHDHKFDPLTARDYYSMAAVFSPLTRQRNGRTELTRPAVPPRELTEKNKADQRVVELKQQIRTFEEPLRKGLLESGVTKISADAVAALKIPEAKRNDAQKQLAKRFSPSFDKEVAAARNNKELASKYLQAEAQKQIAGALAEIARLQSQFTYPPGYFLFEPSKKPAAMHLLKRGNPKQPGPVVEPNVPAAIDWRAEAERQFETADNFTSRRRISLARWIADPANPLTSRVIVNRVWQYHFGVGLVRSPSDFGRRGTEPTHPQLLDWLANWFATNADWSLKKLHRLIMTSSTYRMSKQLNEKHAAADPDNRLYWRFPYRRLEVEAIRDSMLAVSGRLNERLYGAGMYPHIPEDARRSGYNPSGVWRTFNERDASRRTIYAYLKRTLIVPLLDTLDFCDTTRSADRRNVTTVAPQALELLNGDFVNRQSRHFAARLTGEAPDALSHQIDLAYQLALGRTPSADETEAMTEFVNNQVADLIEQDRRRRGPELSNSSLVPKKALALWLDASRGIEKTSNGAVGRWLDQSGKNHHATAKSEPQLSTKGFGGRPTIQFDGKDDWFTLDGSVIASQQFTILAVINDTGAPQRHRNIFGNWNGGVGNSGSSVFLGTTQSGDGRQLRLTDDYASSHLKVVNPQNHFVLTATAESETARIFQNARQVGNRGNPLSRRRLDTAWMIGRQGSAGEFWNGGIAELMVYDRALNEAERFQVWSYLAKKYGIIDQFLPPALTRDQAKQLALVQMCRIIFNLNEFVYTD